MNLWCFALLIGATIFVSNTEAVDVTELIGKLDSMIVDTDVGIRYIKFQIINDLSESLFQLSMNIPNNIQSLLNQLMNKELRESHENDIEIAFEFVIQQCAVIALNFDGIFAGKVIPLISQLSIENVM